MLTKGTDNILGQGVALVDITANLTYKALLALGFGLRLNVVLIISVGHSCLVGNNSCLGNGADKHTVGIKINVLLNVKGHKGVDVAGEKNKTVVRAKGFAVGEFIHISSALEAKLFEH